MTTTLSPRVYVACLACYNESNLVGEWHDSAELEAGEWVTSHQAETGHEEFVIHDSEDCGKLGEVGISEALEVMELIEEHGIGAVIALDHSCSFEEAKDDIENNYRGEHDSLADYARQLGDDCYDLKAMGGLADYIDWERFGDDMETGGDIWTQTDDNGKLHIFDNH